MNDLLLYFENNKKNRIHKWMHYFEIYDRYLSRFRGTAVHLLEIGVYHGGSLLMWKQYFGNQAKLFGLDINPDCRQLEEDQIKILIGDQSDRQFLESLKAQLPRIDVLIDDGSHTMKGQINTFEVLFPHISPTGVYICEDLHTSYWMDYGGGVRKSGTFIEYTKNFVDQIHAWHSEDQKRLPVSDFTRSAYALHYYDSMLVIEKRPIEQPTHRMTGVPVVPSEPLPPEISTKDKLARKIKRMKDRTRSFLNPRRA
jgi:hypothetical protein